MTGDRGGDVRRGPGVGHDDGQVALDVGMPRRAWRPRASVRRPPASPATAISPTMTRSARSSSASRTERVQLADAAGDGAVAADECRAPGMQVRVVLEGRVRQAGVAQPGRDRLDQALGVVQVVRPGDAVPRSGLGVAGQREPEPPPLARAAVRSVAVP